MSAFRGEPGADGSDAAYLAITLLGFGSKEDLAAALGGPHTPAVMGDIANFTNVTPVLQVTSTLA